LIPKRSSQETIKHLYHASHTSPKQVALLKHSNSRLQYLKRG
jgi:hypothetical protein